MDKTCENCHYSDVSVIEMNDVGEMPHLLCRRFPPQLFGYVDGSGTTLWPLVHENEWCGEWRLSKEEFDAQITKEVEEEIIRGETEGIWEPHEPSKFWGKVKAYFKKEVG
jgi:hypothetical protein